MTPQQLKIYDFIREELAGCGVPPTYEDIARHIGIRSKGAVSRHIDHIVTEGLLVRAGKGGARHLRLPDAIDLRTVPTAALQGELMRRGAALGAMGVRKLPMLGRIGATCAHDECGAGVKPGMMYCRDHWFAIPRDIQDKLKLAHGRGDGLAFSDAKIEAESFIGLGGWLKGARNAN